MLKSRYVADKVGIFWGLGWDSRYLVLQLKARFAGIATPVYRLLVVHHPR